MLSNLDNNGIFFKILFDGYDFIHTEIGAIMVPIFLHANIIKLTYLEELYPNADEFIQYCLCENDYIGDLYKKYNVGVYSLYSDSPWKDKEYILFNNKQLNSVKKHDLSNIKFYVCPAYDENNKCYAIGFRIVDEAEVFDAFKWIFTCGNNIIYGKNTVDKDKTCYVVEGFRDYVALKESGYNAIGLGAAKLSQKQIEYINTLKDPILLFDNDKFGLSQAVHYRKQYRVATLIQTNEKDAWDTYSKNIPIKIAEIK